MGNINPGKKKKKSFYHIRGLEGQPFSEPDTCLKEGRGKLGERGWE